MFAHLRRKTSCSVFSLNLSNRCQLHQNVASVSQLLNDENNKLDIPFANAKKGPFVQASPYLENGFEGDAFLKRNLQRILPKEVSNNICNSLVFVLSIVQFYMFIKVYESSSKELSAFGARTGSDIYR